MRRKTEKSKRARNESIYHQQPTSSLEENDFFRTHFQEIIANVSKKYVVLSPLEAAWLRMKEESDNMPKTTLKEGLDNMLRKSFGGCFIKRMNKHETTNYEVNVNKMDLVEFTLKQNDRPIVYSRMNDLSDNTCKYLRETVKDSYTKNGRISQKMFIDNLPTLRLCYQQITDMDAYLRRFTNLVALILTANYLKDFHGKILPPNLNLLELYGNLLLNIEGLCMDSPTSILYLGVGRNYLYQVSTLNYLTRFEHLHLLDLSENDFVDILDVLEKIMKLPKLRSLYLEGNPCSVPVSYVHIIQRLCPHLEYIDGIKYAKDCPLDPQNDDYLGVLQIHGIRFFQVPKPPTVGSRDLKTKIHGFYQLEFEIPLLDPSLQNYESRSLEMTLNGNNEKEEIIKNVHKFDTIDNRKNSRATLRSYGEQDHGKDVEKIRKSYLRYLLKDEEWPVITSFASSKVHNWSPIIHFSNPCIEIPVNREMWRQLRDTMRSVITIRLYYKEMGYAAKSSSKSNKSFRSQRKSRRPSKRSKSKSGARLSRKSTSRKSTVKRLSVKSERSGGQQRSSKRRRSSRRLTKGTASKGLSLKLGKPDKIMEEVLLVRNLIAKIPVPVEIPKWNVPYIGYTWDIRERCLARPYPGLENVKYSESTVKSHKDGKKASRRSKSRGSSTLAGKKISKTTVLRKSKVSIKRKSKISSVRKSKVSSARKSKVSTERKSKMNRRSLVFHQQSVSRKSNKRSSLAGSASTYAIPKILTCHIGVGLKRVGKEESGRSLMKSLKSNRSKKSRIAKKSKRPSKKSLKKMEHSIGKRASKSGRKH